MKRKLDENNEPAIAQQTSTAETQPDATETTTTAATPGFAGLGLDPRLLQAVAKQKYQSPTLVQSKVIPLALDGQDILAKAKTGSGKTAAYILPVLHNILKRKQVSLLASQ